VVTCIGGVTGHVAVMDISLVAEVSDFLPKKNPETSSIADFRILNYSFCDIIVLV
jgi:hypothetical protein